jgi:hypothetical protein
MLLNQLRILIHGPGAIKTISRALEELRAPYERYANSGIGYRETVGLYCNAEIELHGTDVAWRTYDKWMAEGGGSPGTVARDVTAYGGLLPRSSQTDFGEKIAFHAWTDVPAADVDEEEQNDWANGGDVVQD